jgi:hypothetical protein
LDDLPSWYGIAVPEASKRIEASAWRKASCMVKIIDAGQTIKERGAKNGGVIVESSICS